MLFYLRRRRLAKFIRLWRKTNPGNQLTPTAVFPVGLVEAGVGSYGPLHIEYWGSEGEKLIIGCYCSIAKGVKFLLGGDHDYHLPLTYPVRQLLRGEKIIEGISKGPIILGDDVWIGTEALIISGVTIGTGAVIGARSVVTKSVPPYAIVVGNPARVIKYRFSESIILQLLTIEWSKISRERLAIVGELHNVIDESSIDALIRSLSDH